jgi:SAM-dependent methyltransferase
MLSPLRPIPPDRTLEQLANHFRVEKRLADQLKAADRSSRRAIYSTMYDELFRLVPDHPRLTRRSSEERSRLATASKLEMISALLRPDMTFLEFAPGDCKLSNQVATRVRRAIGVDISDQRDPGESRPDNFELIVYDGYTLDGVPDGSVDLIFSDQLIEHLHPEDTKAHFELAFRLLRRGGRYVFRTPHAVTGPHDVSMYFSDEPLGFHLKEWNYRELGVLLRHVSFRSLAARWQVRGHDVALPYWAFTSWEKVLHPLPRKQQRKLGRFLLRQVYVIATR